MTNWCHGNDKTYLGLHVKCPIRPTLNNFGSSRHNFIKAPPPKVLNLTEIRPLGAVPKHANSRTLPKLDGTFRDTRERTYKGQIQWTKLTCYFDNHCLI